MALGAIKRLLAPPTDGADPAATPPASAGAPNDPPTAAVADPSSTQSMPRPRDRVLANLDDMYREAFEAAKATGDDQQMRTLDFAYRREQLYFEILLDIRDAMTRRS